MKDVKYSMAVNYTKKKAWNTAQRNPLCENKEHRKKIKKVGSIYQWTK